MIFSTAAGERYVDRMCADRSVVSNEAQGTEELQPLRVSERIDRNDIVSVFTCVVANELRFQFCQFHSRIPR